MSVDLKKYERRNELQSLSANCTSFYQAIFQKDKKFFEIKGFKLDNRYRNGETLSDGTRIWVKGWIHILRFNDNCFQLMPINGTFGFCQGTNEYSDIQQKILSKIENPIKTSYSLLDEDQGIFYEVTEFYIDCDPEKFDLYNGEKPLAIFKGNRELGISFKGTFSPTRISNLKVCPIAGYILNN